MAGDQKKFQMAMARAEQFSEQKNWAEAGKAYRFALAEFPNNEAAIIGFGKASLYSGQREFALRAFQQVLKVNPMNQQALAYIADIQEESGQSEAAAETYLRLGNMVAGKLDIEAAIDFWSHAIELAPQKIEAHRRLADGLRQQGLPRLAARQLLALAAIYQQQDDFEAAMGAIQEAEALVPGDPGIEVAKEALQRGDLIQAEAISETAAAVPAAAGADFFGDFAEVDTYGEDPFAVEELATEEAPKRGLVGAAQEKALADLANVVFEDSGNPQHTLLIIQAIDLQGQGKLSEAAKSFHQVAQGGMRHPALYFNLGLLWKELGQYNQAVELLNVASQDSQYRLSAQFALGEIYHAAGKLDSALRQLIEVVKTADLQTVPGHKAPEISQKYAGMVNEYLGRGDAGKINMFISTLKSFFAHPAWEKKALEARQLMDSIPEYSSMSLAEYLESPEQEVVVSAMALTAQYMRRNFLMTASEECLRAIQNAPAYLPLHVRLADILLKQGRIEEAVGKYMYIAKVHQTRGTPEQSIDVYRKVLELAPMDLKVRIALINIYLSRGALHNALEEYMILADAHYQLAQVDKAIEKYSEALQLANKLEDGQQWKFDILKQMGDIYTQRFDWARATRAYEELNKLKPNDDRLQRRLIDFYYKQNKLKEGITALDNLIAFYQRQEPLKTVELLRELCDSNPGDLSLRQRMAIAYAQNGMTPEAIGEYDALGEMQLEKGLRQEAIQTIQAILNLGPQDPEGYRRLLAQLGGGGLG